MQIIDIPVGDLKPYQNNPRKNDRAIAAVTAPRPELGGRSYYDVTGGT